jgi:hypothetical protein
VAKLFMLEECLGKTELVQRLSGSGNEVSDDAEITTRTEGAKMLLYPRAYTDLSIIARLCQTKRLACPWQEGVNVEMMM